MNRLYFGPPYYVASLYNFPSFFLAGGFLICSTPVSHRVLSKYPPIRRKGRRSSHLVASFWLLLLLNIKNFGI